jgi:8-oxo-dGTP pyrophosphatase MutT (NUDIX family)
MGREGVLILLRDSSNRIAWQLRDDNSNVPAANSWGIFGGWIEPGESHKEAIIREMKEELSIVLDLSKLEYLGIYKIYPEVIAHIYTYLILDGLKSAILHEGQLYKFMSIKELLGKKTVPRHIELAEWYINGMKKSVESV